jgi:hypothetical protein
MLGWTLVDFIIGLVVPASCLLAVLGLLAALGHTLFVCRVAVFDLELLPLLIDVDLVVLLAKVLALLLLNSNLTLGVRALI